MKRSTLFIVLCLPLFVIAQGDKLPVITAPEFKKDTLSIKHYGAIPDGHTLNTKSITNAIEALYKKGGGVVLVSAGLWLTGPLVLKSNINLHLAIGAILLFTKAFDQYPLVAANWEGIPQMRNQSPISATNASGKLVFDKITYKSGAEVLFRVSGERSIGIDIKNTDGSKAKEKIVYELGQGGPLPTSPVRGGHQDTALAFRRVS